MLYKIKVWRTFHRKDTTQIQNTKIKFKYLSNNYPPL
nr:MAG TPA: hypothetical protein [Caudoviricetes sp.]DAJ61400.1 MAG TPA: hypothetical protein [Caudoviricetes sp.]DAU69055.1 MAG TPA: hypothetical protein [Caudoviricetes sp.]